MSITGERGGTPLKAGFAVADASTASAAASAILAALYRHARSGQGETIETSLLAVAISMQAQIWAEYQCSGRLPARSGNAQPLAAPAADLIAVKDGHIVLSAYMDEHWLRLCKAINQPELASDPRFADNNLRVRNREALASTLHHALGRHTGEEARALLERHGVVVGVVRSYPEVLASADVQATGVFQRVDDGQGEHIRLPGLPFTFGGVGAVSDRAVLRVPRLGEHTAEILVQAGYSAHEIEGLRANGVVA